MKKLIPIALFSGLMVWNSAAFVNTDELLSRAQKLTEKVFSSDKQKELGIKITRAHILSGNLVAAKDSALSISYEIWKDRLLGQIAKEHVARGEVNQTLHLLDQIHFSVNSVSARLLLARHLKGQGEVEKAAGMVQLATEDARKSGISSWADKGYLEVGRFLSDQGEFLKGAAVLRAISHTESRLKGLAYLAARMNQVGTVEGAQTILDECLEVAESAYGKAQKALYLTAISSGVNRASHAVSLTEIVMKSRKALFQKLHASEF